MQMQISASPLAARSFMAFRQRVIFEVGDIIRASGASLAYSLYGQMVTSSTGDASKPAPQQGLPT